MLFIFSAQNFLTSTIPGNGDRMFFTQTPSFLAFQRTIEKNKGKSNIQSLFGVHKIPSDNHIRDLLDHLKPELITPIFEQAFQMIESRLKLDSFRGFAENLLMAIDGTEYFSSNQIHCPQCSTRKLKSGEMLSLSWRCYTSYRQS
jgi:hypothetical protein